MVIEFPAGQLMVTVDVPMGKTYNNEHTEVSSVVQHLQSNMYSKPTIAGLVKKCCKSADGLPAGALLLSQLDQ